MKLLFGIGLLSTVIDDMSQTPSFPVPYHHLQASVTNMQPNSVMRIHKISNAVLIDIPDASFVVTTGRMANIWSIFVSQRYPSNLVLSMTTKEYIAFVNCSL